MTDDDLGVSIFDAVSGKFIDTLRAVLYRLCPRSHVIELYDIFGKENFLKFLDLFSGVEIEVPSRTTLEQGMQDVLIYLTLARTDANQRPKMIRHLAQRTGLTAGEVRSRFVATEKALKDLKLEAQ